MCKSIFRCTKVRQITKPEGKEHFVGLAGTRTFNRFVVHRPPEYTLVALHVPLSLLVLFLGSD